MAHHVHGTVTEICGVHIVHESDVQFAVKFDGNQITVWLPSNEIASALPPELVNDYIKREQLVMKTLLACSKVDIGRPDAHSTLLPQAKMAIRRPSAPALADKDNKVAPKRIRKPTPVITGGKIVYKVEKILDHRKNGRVTEYLIKWEGYTTSESTWEPESNVGDDLIAQYRN